MGIVDFFRPRHRHSDPTVRAQVVREVAADDRILVEMALRDRDASVRRAAIARVASPHVLADIATHDGDDANRNAASARACELWLPIACGSDADAAEVALAGLEQLAEGRILARVATVAQLPAIRTAAGKHVRDDRGLVELARLCRNEADRRGAISRVESKDALRALATSTEDKELGGVVVDRIAERFADDDEALSAIAHKAKLKTVRQRARKILQSRHDAASARPEAQAAQAMQRRRATKAQLLRELEPHLLSANVAAAARALAATHEAWQAAGGADRDLDEKLAAATGTITRRQAALAEARSARAGVRAAASEAPVAAAVHSDEGDDDDHSAHAAAQAAREAEFADKRAQREAKQAEREAKQAEFKAKDEAREAKRLARASEAVTVAAELSSMVEKMEHVAAAAQRKGASKLLTDSHAMLMRLQRLDGEFDITRYERARAQLVILTEAQRDADEWQRFANVPKAEALVADAKVLLASVHEVPEHAGRLLKELQADWKDLGPLPRKRSQELWEEFKSTCDAIFETVRTQRAEADVQYDAIAAAKERLITEAQALSVSTDWATTAKRLRDMQTEWKAAGNLPRRRGDELWQRFKSACDVFFAARAPHMEAERAEEAANLARKLDLCERVESLRARAGTELDGPAWGDVVRGVRAAQQEWQAIGHVPRRDASPIYERFRAACDGVFAARDNAKGAAHEARASAASALLADLNAAAESGDIARALAADAAVRNLDDAPSPTVTSAWRNMVEKLVARDGAALAGTALDPRKFAAARLSIVQRARELLSPEAPALDAADMAQRLAQAMADNALAKFRFAGKAPAEAVSDLRDEWNRVGPELDADLRSQFDAVCEQVLQEAGVATRTAPRQAAAARTTERPPAKLPPAPVGDQPPAQSPAAPVAAAAPLPIVASGAAVEAARVRSVSAPPPMDDVDEAWDAAEAPPPSEGSAESPPSAAELAGDGATEGEGLDTGWD